MYRVRDFSLQNLPVGRSLLIVRFDESPTYDPLSVEDISRRVRPALAVRIENAVAVDYLVVFVFEKREVEIAGKSLFEFLHKVFGIVVTVDAYREDLNPILFLWG